MSRLEELYKKMDELERRCPGTKFIHHPLELCELGLSFYSPNQYGQEKKFKVNLMELHQTPEQWLDEEISRHPEPSDRDQYYRVICPVCGPVQIGYSNYLAQLSFPNLGWYCTNCQSPASFDDEYLERWIEDNEQY